MMSMSPGAMAKLEQWVVGSLQGVAPGKSVDIHVDELTRLLGWGDLSLECLWTAYIQVIAILGTKRDEYMPILAIDLEVSEALDVRIPSWNEALSQLSDTPPNIYLTHRKSRMLLPDFEIFRSPMVSPPPFAMSDPDVFYFYVCSRSGHERRMGWEYGRYIAAEQYPPEFRI